MSLWGLNYHRKSVSEIVKIEKETYTINDLEMMCASLVELTNKSRLLISSDEQNVVTLNLSKDKIIEKSVEGFRNYSKEHLEFSYKNHSVKKFIFPEIMSYVGIAGFYFPFTGEAIVNIDPPDFNLPATVCHEMAHQIGFAPEDEANFIAYHACIANSSPEFQYSGYLMALRYSMSALKKVNPEACNNLKKKYSNGVKLDIVANNKYWQKFKNPFVIYSENVNDLFLKANSQKAGIESYNLMVQLLLAEFRKNGLLKIN